MAKCEKCSCDITKMNMSTIEHLEQLLKSLESSIEEVERWSGCRDQCEDFTDGYAQGIEDSISEFENLADEIKALIRVQAYEISMTKIIKPQDGQLELPLHLLIRNKG